MISLRDSDMDRARQLALANWQNDDKKTFLYNELPCYRDVTSMSHISSSSELYNAPSKEEGNTITLRKYHYTRHENMSKAL